MITWISPVHRTLAQVAPEPTVGVWSQGYSSYNVTDLNLARGQPFRVQVNITNAVRLQGFDLILLYDPSFIEALSLDFTTDTAFGDRVFVGKNLISKGPEGQQVGEVQAAAVQLGLPSFNGTGVLVHINFRVKAVGVSPLGLTDVSLVQEVSKEARLLPPPRTVDGYFRNTPKLGPVAEFAWVGEKQGPLIQGDRVTFNATLSHDPDNATGPSQGVRRFEWTWGDDKSEVTNQAVLDHVFSRGNQPAFGDFWVRLIVVDYEGFKGLKIQVVHVSQLGVHDLAVAFLEALPSNPLPGVNVTVRVAVQNLGTFPETYNLTLFFEGREIVRFTGHSISEGARSPVFVHNITTSGLEPRLYEVKVNATLIGAMDEKPRNNAIRAFFTVARSSAGVLTFLAAGIAVVGTGVGIGVFLKRRRPREVF